MSRIFNSILEDNYKTGELSRLISKSFCLASVVRILGYSTNGRYTKLLRDFCILTDIDLSHFNHNGKTPAKLVEKLCPQCNKPFTFKTSEPRETCSHACANTYFAYKQGAKNRKDGSTTYVSTLHKYFVENKRIEKCCACEETRVLDVHHVDEDRLNNDISNLVFLCPTHHAVYHRLYDQEVIDAIIKELDTRP